MERWAVASGVEGSILPVVSLMTEGSELSFVHYVPDSRYWYLLVYSLLRLGTSMNAQWMQTVVVFGEVQITRCE